MECGVRSDQLTWRVLPLVVGGGVWAVALSTMGLWLCMDESRRLPMFGHAFRMGAGVVLVALGIFVFITFVADQLCPRVHPVLSRGTKIVTWGVIGGAVGGAMLAFSEVLT